MILFLSFPCWSLNADLSDGGCRLDVNGRILPGKAEDPGAEYLRTEAPISGRGVHLEVYTMTCLPCALLGQMGTTPPSQFKTAEVGLMMHEVDKWMDM